MPRRLIGLLLVLAAAAAGIAALSARSAGATTLRPPPDLPVLTAGEIAGLDDAGLLAAIQREGTRRLLAAGRGWDAGRTVLPEALRHLWTIGTLEDDLRQSGFLHVQRLATGVPPMLPPLADLAEAYHATGQAALAEVVDQAVAASAERRDLSPQDAAFRRAFDSQTALARRCVFARMRSGELLPQTP